MSNSSELVFRPLEIEVKSATLATELEGNFYVRISVNYREQSVRTKLANRSKDSNLSWNQTFGFSVPEDFISDGQSRVCFTLFKARRYMLSDLAVGQIRCDVRAMMPVEECMDKGVGSGDPTCREPEIQEEETFELRASAEEIPIVNESSMEVGSMKLSLCSWRKYYPYELNLNGRSAKTYPIIKGSEKMGKFTMQRPSSAGMMMMIQQKKVPAKRSAVTLCFAS